MLAELCSSIHKKKRHLPKLFQKRKLDGTCPANSGHAEAGCGEVIYSEGA
jgi:hypothetical protein